MNEVRITAGTDIELLETRLAARVTALLTLPAEDVSPDVRERLRFAREQALARAREARAAPASVGLGSSGGAGILGAGGWSHNWLAMLVPVAALLVGLYVVSHWNSRERSVAAAEIDAALLSDQLPPAAYADPGFVAFLKLAQP